MAGLLQRFRQKVIDRDYYLSSHAEEEMRADDLERSDVENALLKGRIDKRLTRDPRGTRYLLKVHLLMADWSTWCVDSMNNRACG